MTNLADLTPQERAAYIGCWVYHYDRPKVYAGEFESNGNIKHGAVLIDPNYGRDYVAFDDCALMPDSRRAWQSDGAPLPLTSPNSAANDLAEWEADLQDRSQRLAEKIEQLTDLADHIAYTLKEGQ